MKKLLFLLFILFWASDAYAAQPAIFFSDLESGPNVGGQDNKGAFVTIWGKHFGTTRNDSVVTIGDSEADNYPIWSDTKIIFQLGEKAQTGDIIIKTSEGVSNGVPFTVRKGDIYFVKTTGSFDGWGTWESPWNTIERATDYITPGDIVYICDGVEAITQGAYRTCVDLSSSGTSEMPKALVAYPGAKVVVGDESIERGFYIWASGKGPVGSYWVISQLHIKAQVLAVPGGEGFRIVGNKITAPNGDGAAATTEGDNSHIKILGNEYYECGNSQTGKKYHVIYINNHKGKEITDIEIGWNIIRDSMANRAIQIYSDGNGHADISDVRIHDNIIINNRGNAVNLNNHCTGEIKVYNNIFSRCGIGPDPRDGLTSYAGVYIGGGMGDYENDATIYLDNNIIHDCGFSKRSNMSGALLIGGGFVGKIYVRNNIFYSGGDNSQPYMVSGSKAPAEGSNNLFYGKNKPFIFIPFDTSWRVPSWDKKAVSADPLFMDMENFDFHVKPNSPCIDAGADTTSVVATDKDGVRRPQGKAVDIGVYEY